MNKTYTKIQRACLNNDVTAIKTIIASKQDLNVKEILFFTGVSKNVNGSDILNFEIIENLALINVLTETSNIYEILCTPIHIATYKGYNELLKILLDAKADFNIQDSKIGYTPLHIAVVKENFVMAKQLLDAGANPNIKSYYSFLSNCIPLHIAAHIGSIDLVKLLLKYGSNPDDSVSNCECITALHINYRNEEIFNVLFDCINEKTLVDFFKYIIIGDEKDMMIKLLDKMSIASLVQISKKHPKILGAAALVGNESVLSVLIAAGVVVNNDTSPTNYLLSLCSNKSETIMHLLFNNYCPYRVSGQVLHFNNDQNMQIMKCSNCHGDIKNLQKGRTVHRRGGGSKYYFCGEQQVSSLQEIARYNIRKVLLNNNLKITLKQSIEVLPLPQFMKNYIYNPIKI